jgi:hypothetical protein
MPKANPAREIAVILVLAAVFAGGLYFYISSSIPPLSPPLLVASASPSASSGVQGARPAEDTRPDDARRVAGAFVQHLGAQRIDDAYLMMASAYRQTTPLSAFRAACLGSPFLSTAASVSIARTREERAPGQAGRGSLSASGVLVTRSGTVDVTFYFVDDPAGVAIVNVNVAGTPVLPMGTGIASGAPDARAPAAKR